MAVAALAYHADAFYVPARRTNNVRYPHPTRNNGQQPQRLQAFATDVYLDNLYHVHANTVTEDYNDYLDQMTYFSQQEVTAGMGTTDTADMEALRACFLSSPTADDLWTRIALAADFGTTINPQTTAGDIAQASTSVMGAAFVTSSNVMAGVVVEDPYADSMVPPPGPVVGDSLVTWATASAEAQANAATAAAVGIDQSTSAQSPAINAAPIVADITATATSVPTVADATLVPDTNDALRSQLSEMTYSSSSASASPLTGLEQSWGEWTHASQTALQNSQKGFSQVLAGWGQSSQSALQNTVQGVSDSVSVVANAPSQIAAETQAGWKLVTNDLSVSELAERMAQGVVQLGKMIVTILNIIVEAITGETVADLVAQAQTAVADLTSSAVSSVVETLRGIGEMSVADFLTSVAKLVVLVTTVLYRIFSGIVEVVSGKNIGEWGAMAVKAVEQQADQVLLAAGHAAADLSHKSITELVAMLGNLEQHVTHSVMVAATQMVDTADASMALASLSSTMQ